jgi:hypothetical protein
MQVIAGLLTCDEARRIAEAASIPGTAESYFADNLSPSR